MCDVAIQGVVISAFHFAVQLERSRFQIHPHTDAEREKERDLQGGGENWGEASGEICRDCNERKR